MLQKDNTQWALSCYSNPLLWTCLDPKIWNHLLAAGKKEKPTCFCHWFHVSWDGLYFWCSTGQCSWPNTVSYLYYDIYDGITAVESIGKLADCSKDAKVFKYKERLINYNNDFVKIIETFSFFLKSIHLCNIRIAIFCYS